MSDFEVEFKRRVSLAIEGIVEDAVRIGMTGALPPEYGDTV